jgi:tetratricopeptide (TPR) repeat protein
MSLRLPLLTLLLLASATTARAASPAEESFQEGRRLFAEGKIDEACAHFAESYDMVASSGTLLNLALCHEKQGKTATAWNEYRAAARLARNQGREDRAAVADESAKALEANLARISITAVEAVPGLHVATEAGPLGDGGLKVEVPIDPGSHKVTATAPGYLSWSATVEVKEAEQLTVQIPKLEPEPLLPAFAQLADARSTETRRSSVGLYLGAGGVVSLAAGVALWSVAYSKLQSAKEACTQGCSQADRDNRVSDIQTLKGVAIGAWVVGGALVASGGYLVLRKGKGTNKTATVALDPSLGGVLIQGTF